MDSRLYTIILSIIFGLVGVVTCLIVLVILLVLTRQGPLWGTVNWQGSGEAVFPTLARPTNAQPSPVALPSPIVITRLAGATPVLELVIPALAPTPTPLVQPTRSRPTPSVTKPLGPTATSTFPSNIQYVLDGEVKPDVKRACMGGAIFGTFRDINGKPVAGMRVRVYNEFISEISAPSKAVDAPDAGYYDFIINPKPGRWNVVVVDGAGNPISPEVQVVRPGGEEVCYFEVNWRAVR